MRMLANLGQFATAGGTELTKIARVALVGRHVGIPGQLRDIRRVDPRSVASTQLPS
jgi:hypothetical protein